MLTCKLSGYSQCFPTSSLLRSPLYWPRSFSRLLFAVAGGHCFQAEAKGRSQETEGSGRLCNQGQGQGQEVASRGSNVPAHRAVSRCGPTRGRLVVGFGGRRSSGGCTTEQGARGAVRASQASGSRLRGGVGPPFCWRAGWEKLRLSLLLAWREGGHAWLVLTVCIVLSSDA